MLNSMMATKSKGYVQTSKVGETLKKLDNVKRFCMVIDTLTWNGQHWG
jgi:hypothetical protein